MIFSKDYQWISSLVEAIHQNVILKAKYLSAFSVGFLVLILISCSSTKHVVEVTDHTIHDTIYQYQQQHDSIYLHDSSTVQYRFGTIDTTVINALGINLRVDTVYQDRMKYGYKYKLLRDTTYINRVDSIPIIKEVTVTKEVKYTPWYAKTFAWIGVICLVIIVLCVILKFVLKR